MLSAKSFNRNEKSETQQTPKVKTLFKAYLTDGGNMIFSINKSKSLKNTKNMTTEDVMHLLEEDGWGEEINDGISRKYKHKIKTGTITLPVLDKEIPAGMLDSIFQAAGLKPPF